MIVEVPEAEAVVREIRLRHDSSAARGVPAHITVLSPFADGSDVEEEPLAELFASRPRFDFVLDRVERWDDGIVWLHPEPSRPFEELTAAVWRRWPDYPPYGGSIDVVIPHLTISETPIEVDVELPTRSHASADRGKRRRQLGNPTERFRSADIAMGSHWRCAACSPRGGHDDDPAR